MVQRPEAVRFEGYITSTFTGKAFCEVIDGIEIDLISALLPNADKEEDLKFVFQISKSKRIQFIQKKFEKEGELLRDITKSEIKISLEDHFDNHNLVDEGYQLKKVGDLRQNSSSKQGRMLSHQKRVIAGLRTEVQHLKENFMTKSAFKNAMEEQERRLLGIIQTNKEEQDDDYSYQSQSLDQLNEDQPQGGRQQQPPSGRREQRTGEGGMEVEGNE